jgi:NAD(P)-dependent dehydrogenase (short-subunit alcohol dehydrogenase family)
LCPGGIQNNQNKSFLIKIEKLIPLKRMAKQNDYNSTIVWMLSDENSYMNGAVISVDGGRTAW